MYAMRRWSARNARWLNAIYDVFEAVLVALHPLFVRIGYQRVDKGVMAVEKITKGFLFDSQSCGQCTLGSTGMVCPMNCPKNLRNGPCGGVRADGSCEVQPDVTCVWVTAWEVSRRLRDGAQAIQVIQSPVDVRLRGTSAWLRAARNKRDSKRQQQAPASS